MAEIDTQKDVYLFLHGKMDLKEKAINFEFKSTAKATNLYEQTLRDRFNE